MKRAIVIAISVILALVVAAPIASGQSSSQGKNLGKGQNLGKLTGDWWNWVVSTNPSPPNPNEDGPCGAAPTLGPDSHGNFTGDPEPYSKCAQAPIDDIASNSTMIATLDGQPLEIQRLESGPFTLTNPSPRSEILPNAPPGSYKSWASGFWVYLPQGLEPRVEPYTLHWSVLPKVSPGFTQDITYNLTVVD